MLDDAHMRFAIEDARVRHKAVIDLINASSDQAIRFLSLYVTLGLAAGSGAIALFARSTSIPTPVAFGLLCALAPLLAGCLFCFQTIKPAALTLPGRDPEFWLWAARDDVSQEQAFNAYLGNLNEKLAANRKLNEETATALTRAKSCGVLAVVVAVLAGGAAVLISRL
jgi:hypothetical protein